MKSTRCSLDGTPVFGSTCAVPPQNSVGIFSVPVGCAVAWIQNGHKQLRMKRTITSTVVSFHSNRSTQVEISQDTPSQIRSHEAGSSPPPHYGTNLLFTAKSVERFCSIVDPRCRGWWLSRNKKSCELVPSTARTSCLRTFALPFFRVGIITLVGLCVMTTQTNKQIGLLVGETHLFQSFIISIGFSAIFTVSYALFGSSRKASRAFFVLPLRTTLRPPNFIFNFHKQWRKNESGEEQIDVSESSAHCSTTMAGVSYNKLARLTEQHESEMGIFPS